MIINVRCRAMQTVDLKLHMPTFDGDLWHIYIHGLITGVHFYILQEFLEHHDADHDGSISFKEYTGNYSMYTPHMLCI